VVVGGEAHEEDCAALIAEYQASDQQQRRALRQRLSGSTLAAAFFREASRVDSRDRAKKKAEAAERRAQEQRQKALRCTARGQIGGQQQQQQQPSRLRQLLGGRHPAVLLSEGLGLSEADGVGELRDAAQRMQAYIARQRHVLLETSLSVDEQLRWQLLHIGNPFWFVLHNRDVHPSIKTLVRRLYPLAYTLTPSNVPSGAPSAFVAGDAVRYSKTDEPVLEDLVFVLRHTAAYGLGGTQLVTSAQLVAWQQRQGPASGFEQADGARGQGGQLSVCSYLTPAALSERYPHHSAGLLSDALLAEIVGRQESDHLRVFSSMVRGAPAQHGQGKQDAPQPPTCHYGAHQGLVESVRYTELREVPPEMKYAIHLTRRDLAAPILGGQPTSRCGKERTDRPPKGGEERDQGCLVLLGRYIHSFGWAEPTADGGYALIESFWKDVKMRLYFRFRSSRVGIAIDMAELRRHYEGQGVAWTDVCGVNAIGTVIFLRTVPAACLRARGRDWANRVSGSALPMEEMWRL
jgi:hypothetical protein